MIDKNFWKLDMMKETVASPSPSQSDLCTDGCKTRGSSSDRYVTTGDSGVTYHDITVSQLPTQQYITNTDHH